MGRPLPQFVFLFLVAVFTAGQEINRNVHVAVDVTRDGRLGFGGIGVVSDTLKTICRERCSPSTRYFVDTKLLFCVFKCASFANVTATPKPATNNTMMIVMPMSTMNMTAPAVNMTALMMNMTAPARNMTALVMNMTAAVMNMTAQAMNMTAQAMNMSMPMNETRPMGG